MFEIPHPEWLLRWSTPDGLQRVHETLQEVSKYTTVNLTALPGPKLTASSFNRLPSSNTITERAVDDGETVADDWERVASSSFGKMRRGRRGWTLSLEERAKLSAAHLESYKGPKGAEIKAKQSATRRATLDGPQGPELRAKFSAVQLERWNGPKGAEYRADVSAKHLEIYNGPRGPEIKAKISAANDVRFNGPQGAEYRAKLSADRLEYHRGPKGAETRAKQSAGHHASYSGQQGIELKAKLSAAQLSNWNSEAGVQRRIKARQKVVSEETRRKIGEASRRPHSEEAKKKISQSSLGHSRNRGRIQSAEHKVKRATAVKLDTAKKDVERLKSDLSLLALSTRNTLHKRLKDPARRLLYEGLDVDVEKELKRFGRHGSSSVLSEHTFLVTT